MIRSAVVALVAAFLAVHVSAQTIKQVEVINFPDPQNVTGQVEVTNLPTCEAPARFQLVGFSSETFTGGQGVLGFTAACGAEFPGSRMCTSVEAMETVRVPSGLSGSAWIRPVFVDVGELAVDVSGVHRSHAVELTCDGWHANLLTGLLITAEGAFTYDICTSAFSVACCAPVP
jgi:hypothetical protein